MPNRSTEYDAYDLAEGHVNKSDWEDPLGPELRSQMESSVQAPDGQQFGAPASNTGEPPAYGDMDNLPRMDREQPGIRQPTSFTRTNGPREMQSFERTSPGQEDGLTAGMRSFAGGGGSAPKKDWDAEARAQTGWQPESDIHRGHREAEGLYVSQKANLDAQGHLAEAQGHDELGAQIARDNHIEANRMKMESDAADDAEARIATERAHTEAMRLNPDQYKENLGFGGTALAALTMIVGGIGAGIAGEKNKAHEVFDAEVKKNIDKQKDDYERGLHKIKGMENDYSRRRDRVKDERATRHMMTADKYRGAAELVKGKLSAISAENSNLDGAAAVNHLEMKALEHDDLAAQAVRQHSYALRTADASRRAAAGAAHQKHLQTLAETRAAEDYKFEHQKQLQQMKNDGKAGRGGSGGAGESSGDPILDEIYRQPKGVQGKLLSEYEQSSRFDRDWEKTSKQMSDGFGARRDPMRLLGSHTTAEKKVSESNANLMLFVQQHFKGNPTEQEAQKIVGPYLISAFDSDEDVKRKLSAIHNMAESSKIGTPFIDRVRKGDGRGASAVAVQYDDELPTKDDDEPEEQ